MNLQQFKSEISQKAGIVLEALNLSRQLDKDDKPTEWLSHWNNDKRVRIVFHQDVANKIKENPSGIDGLAYKMEVIPATDEREAYTRFVGTLPNIEMSF